MSSAITTLHDLNSLEPLDSEWVQQRLTEFPFVQIDGVTNVRTLGPYPARLNSSEGASEGLTTRPYQLFRSAEVSGITEEGEYSRTSVS